MNCYILAAGYGTRLKPLTENIPKCLVDINGIPLLHHWLKILTKKNYFNNIYINTHYLNQQVDSFIENFNWKNIVQLRHEEKLLGTAGTILNDIHLIENEEIMIIHADNLTFFNLDDFINKHKNRKQNIEISMMTFFTDNPENCGTLVLKDNVVDKYFEKEKSSYSNIANGAVYIFSIEAIRKLKKFENLVDISKDVIPKFIGSIQTYHNDIYFRDIGTYDSYIKGNKEFKFIAEIYKLEYFNEKNY